MAEIDGLFPKLRDSSRIGRVGVDVVTSIVNDQLEWIFRQTHQEHDFGIDGYIDIVKEDGSVTGQTLAVQIKTGESFLNTKTSAGYVFLGELKHLNYYLNHPVSILIILCDPRDRTCYWELFSADKTEGTVKGWKMVIPFANRLSGSSKDALNAIVGPVQDHSDALRKHWAFTKALHESDRVMLIISRLQIETLRFDSLTGFFNRISSNRTTCTKLQGKVVFSIAGYERDERELWEIPEVRKWIEFAEPLVESWFFFLYPEKGLMNSLGLLASCICESHRVAVVGSIQRIAINFRSERFLHFVRRNWLGLNMLTENLGIDEQNEKISMAVIAALGIPQGEK